MIAFVSTAWSGHTDRTRDAAHDFCAALAECGISHKAAAIEMGLSERDLSRQLAGLDPLNHYRTLLLPPEVEIAYMRRRVGRAGGVVLLADAVAFLRGAALLGIAKVQGVLERKAS